MRSQPHMLQTQLFGTCADALVAFLSQRSSSSAISGPDMREMVLQTISMLLQTKQFVTNFEENADARANLVTLSP